MDCQDNPTQALPTGAVTCSGWKAALSWASSLQILRYEECDCAAADFLCVGYHARQLSFELSVPISRRLRDVGEGHTVKEKALL